MPDNTQYEIPFYSKLHGINEKVLQQTVIKHIWTLPKEVSEMLSSYFRRTAVGSEFMSRLDTVDNCVDIITLPKTSAAINSVRYEVVYQSCSYELIEDNPTMKLLLSFRAVKSLGIAYAIVRPFLRLGNDEKLSDKSFANIQRLSELR